MKSKIATPTCFLGTSSENKKNKLQILSKKTLITAIAILGLSSCVQKSHHRKVTLLLEVSGISDIKSVGVRGENKPFSWNDDVPMEVVKKDSLYKKTFEIETGRLCTEIKFTINGEFELQNQNNRKVYFDKKNVTIYNAKFNVIQ